MVSSRSTCPPASAATRADHGPAAFTTASTSSTRSVPFPAIRTERTRAPSVLIRRYLVACEHTPALPAYVVGKQVDQSPGVNGGVRYRERTHHLAADGRLFGHEAVRVDLLGGDAREAAALHEAFRELRWILTQGDEHPANRLDGRWRKRRDRLAFTHALGRELGIADRITRPALQQAVKTAAGTRAEIVVFDEGGVEASQAEVACHRAAGGTAADYDHPGSSGVCVRTHFE